VTLVTGTCACGAECERELAEGRYAETFNRRPFICADCDAERSAQWAAEREERDSRELRRLIAEKLTRLPVLHSRLHLDELDTAGRERALDAARRLIAGEIHGLTLIGSIGTGKTQIAASTVRAMIERDPEQPAPRWVSVTTVLSDLGRAFNDPRRQQAVDALSSDRVGLVLDDLDKSKPTAHAASEIFNAIDLATTHERQLIVTTNLMPSQLRTKWPAPYGEAIASRLGYCELHKITGHDRRLSEAA